MRMQTREMIMTIVVLRREGRNGEVEGKEERKRERERKMMLGLFAVW